MSRRHHPRMRPLVLGAAFLFLTSFLVLFGSEEVLAAPSTWTVDDDGGGDYTTIMEAVDAASAGDTIRVWNGTYNETVWLNKTLSLVGNCSDGVRIGGTELACLYIHDDWCNVSLITFDCYDLSTDIGILAYGNLTNIDSCRIIGLCERGIVSNGAHNRVIGCDIWAGVCGIDAKKADHNTLSNNDITGNINAVTTTYCNYTTIGYNKITANSGIALQGSNNCTIEGNQISKGYLGLTMIVSHDNIFHDNTIMGQVTQNIGCSWSHRLEFMNNTLNNSEMGIQFFGCNDALVECCNLANYSTIAVDILSCEHLTFRNCSIESAMIFAETAHYSSGISFINSTFVDADTGFNILGADNILIENCTIEHTNDAIAFDDADHTEDLVLTNSHFINCIRGMEFGIGSNPMIMDCYFDGGEFPLTFSEVSSLEVTNVVFNSTICPINVQGPTPDTWVYGNTITNSSFGINFKDVYAGMISNNHIDTCFTGLRVHATDYWEDNSYTKILNNTVTNCVYGIQLEGTLGTQFLRTMVMNNTLHGNDLGIISNTMEECSIVNNRITDGNTGMSIIYPTWCVINDNVIDGMEWAGIAGWCGYGNRYMRNIVTNCSNGIDLDCGEWERVSDNVCSYNSQNGIHTTQWSSDQTINRNICEFNGHAGIDVDDESYGDGGPGGGGGDGREYGWLPPESFSVVENTCRYNDYGITVAGSYHYINANTASYNSQSGIYCTAQFSTVAGNIMEDNNAGILAEYAQGSFFLNNNASLNENGIKVRLSDWVDVSGNTLTSNANSGVSTDFVDYSFIRSNSCLGGSKGIFMDSSEFNIIENNDITSAEQGIYVSYSQYIQTRRNDVQLCKDHGIYYHQTDISEISNNTILNNQDGIGVAGKGNLIKFNTIASSTSYGLSIIGPLSKNNHIYLNHFSGNNKELPQAQDNSNTGNWFNTSDRGNYWSDWTTPDEDGDGIVDKPYLVPGEGHTRDQYPLTVPYGDPIIITTDILTCYEDEEYVVHYEAFDADSPFMSLNWTLITDASWLNMSELGSLYGTPTNDDVGTHNVKVIVDDGYNEDSTSFIIEVINTNDAPDIIAHPVENDHTFEDMLYSFKLVAEDVDPTADIMNWSVSTDADFLTINSKTGLLRGLPVNSDIGHYEVIVTVTDNNGGYDSYLFNLSVLNVNDPPAGTNKIVTAMEDVESFRIYVDDMFTDEDGDDLTIRYIGAPPYIVFNHEIEFNKLLKLTLYPDYCGEFNITMEASDGVSSTTATITVEITPVNDRPSYVTIEGFAHGARIWHGQNITLTSVVDDPDLKYEGDTFRYAWSSNISGPLGTSADLEKLELEPGHHNITLIVQDKALAARSAFIHMVVGKQQSTLPTDDGGSSSSSTNLAMFAWIPFVILFLILTLILVLFFAYSRLKQEPERSDQIPPYPPPPPPPPTGDVEDFEVTMAMAKKRMFTYYELLNIPRDAQRVEIKRAYRRMCKSLHPDLVANDEDTIKQMVDINRAKEVLMDEKRRKRYDALISARELGQTGLPYMEEEEEEEEDDWEDDFDDEGMEDFEGVGTDDSWERVKEGIDWDE